MERYLKLSFGVLLGLLLICTFGVFFLYVTAMSVAELVLIVLGFVMMFGLGIMTGGRRIRISRMRDAWRAHKLAH